MNKGVKVGRTAFVGCQTNNSDLGWRLLILISGKQG